MKQWTDFSFWHRSEGRYPRIRPTLKSTNRKAEHRDYAIVLMLAAVISAAGHAASVLIEIGRSAAWWR
jgi:hypothetical protein